MFKQCPKRLSIFLIAAKRLSPDQIIGPGETRDFPYQLYIAPLFIKNIHIAPMDIHRPVCLPNRIQMPVNRQIELDLRSGKKLEFSLSDLVGSLDNLIGRHTELQQCVTVLGNISHREKTGTIQQLSPVCLPLATIYEIPKLKLVPPDKGKPAFQQTAMPGCLMPQALEHRTNSEASDQCHSIFCIHLQLPAPSWFNRPGLYPQQIPCCRFPSKPVR